MMLGTPGPDDARHPWPHHPPGLGTLAARDALSSHDHPDDPQTLPLEGTRTPRGNPAWHALPSDRSRRERFTPHTVKLENHVFQSENKPLDTRRG